VPRFAFSVKLARTSAHSSQRRQHGPPATASTAGPVGNSSDRRRISGEITTEEDIAAVAGQLAELTHEVEEMAAQLKALRDRADNQERAVGIQREQAEVQQERIDLAARELAEVSARIQAAADALRASL